MDSRLSSREHKLEVGIYSKRKASVYGTDVRTHEPLSKNPRLSETSVNSLITEEHTDDGKNDAIMHSSQDHSNDMLTHEPSSKKPRFLEASVNSLISAEHSDDGKDDAVLHNFKDKSNKNFSSGVCIFLNSRKGSHRRNLHEVCQKLHCREPQFELIKEVGMPHKQRFLFKVVVDILNNECLSIQGEQEGDHARAKDSAAYKMLVELAKQGLCSILP